MKRKITLVIGYWALGLCAAFSLAVAVGLIIEPTYPLRAHLLKEGILGAVIGLFGMLSAGFIAAIALLYVNRQTLTYSWRRDQSLKDIETIYEPLYQDVSILTSATESLDFINYAHEIHNWDRIKSTFLGTKLKLMERQLYEELQDLFSNYTEYVRTLSDAREMVTDTAQRLIEKRLDQKIAEGNKGLLETVSLEPTQTVKEQVLTVMPERLDGDNNIFSGFLKGKSVREWSALQSGDEESYLKTTTEIVNGAGYSTYLTFSIEEIQDILDGLFNDVKADAQIMKRADWCLDFARKANQLQKKLEDHIIKPQLT